MCARPLERGQQPGATGKAEDPSKESDAMPNTSIANKRGPEQMSMTIEPARFAPLPPNVTRDGMTLTQECAAIEQHICAVWAGWHVWHEKDSGWIHAVHAWPDGTATTLDSHGITGIAHQVAVYEHQRARDIRAEEGRSQAETFVAATRLTASLGLGVL